MSCTILLGLIVYHLALAHCVFEVQTELLSVVTSLSFCPGECRSHCCCSFDVGLKPIAFDTQPKLRILSLHVFRQFHRLHCV